MSFCSGELEQCFICMRIRACTESWLSDDHRLRMEALAPSLKRAKTSEPAVSVAPAALSFWATGEPYALCPIS